MTAPQKRKKRKITIHTIDSLMERTIEEGYCVEWSGYAYAGNNPQVSHDGKMIAVRKLVMLLNERKVPDLAYFKTTCGNDLCVRLEHIKVVDQKKHMQVMNAAVDHQNPLRIAKLQSASAHRRKLSQEQVDDIMVSDESSRVLAQAHGVSHGTITKIKANRARRIVNASLNPFAGLMR
jgi:hypothetical protein